MFDESFMVPLWYESQPQKSTHLLENTFPYVMIFTINENTATGEPCVHYISCTYHKEHTCTKLNSILFVSISFVCELIAAI